MKQIDVLVQKAGENIEVAEMLLHQGYFDISASRAYYAMFYLAEALLFSRKNTWPLRVRPLEQFFSHSHLESEYRLGDVITREHTPDHRSAGVGFVMKQHASFPMAVIIGSGDRTGTFRTNADCPIKVSYAERRLFQVIPQ